MRGLTAFLLTFFILIHFQSFTLISLLPNWRGLFSFCSRLKGLVPKFVLTVHWNRVGLCSHTFCDVLNYQMANKMFY